MSSPSPPPSDDDDDFQKQLQLAVEASIRSSNQQDGSDQLPAFDKPETHDSELDSDTLQAMAASEKTRVTDDERRSQSRQSNLPSSLPIPSPTSSLLTLEKFSDLWEVHEKAQKVSTAKVESNTLIKTDNEDQYGRISFPTMNKIASDPDLLGLKRGDTFLDVGSGIGNAVLQVALTFGCDAWGIEKWGNRHEVRGEGGEGEVC